MKFRFAALQFLFVAVASSAPTLGPGTVTPASILTGQPTLVTVSCPAVLAPGDPAPLGAGVSLVRVDDAGQPVEILGVMNDSGVDGDAVAGDLVFTASATLTELITGQVHLQCTGAFPAFLRRVRSADVSITVEAPLVTPPDTTAPTLTLSPPPGAQLEGPNIELRADYADDGSGVATGTFQALLDGVDMTAKFAVGALGAVYNAELLAGEHTFAVTVSDADGNVAAAATTFDVADPPETIAPTLTLSPPSGALLEGPDIELRANYADDGSGVATNTFEALLDGVDMTALFAVGESAAVYNAELLAGEHTFSVTISDVDGNQATAATTFEVADDLTPPEVSSFDPGEDPDNVPSNAGVVVNFNEALTDSPAPPTVELLLPDDFPADQLPAGFPPDTSTVPAEVTLSPDGLSATVRATAAFPFPPSTRLRIRVSLARDLANNVMSGVFEDAFTTSDQVDEEPPFVVSTTPAQGRGDVPSNAPFVAFFSERIDPATLDETLIVVRDSFGLTIEGSWRLEPGGRRATFLPTLPWPLGRRITVILQAPVADLAGNVVFRQFSNFTIGLRADNDGLKLTGVSPPDGFVGAPTNARVDASFDEQVSLASLEQGFRVTSDGVEIPGSFFLIDGRRRVRFRPQDDFAAETEFVVEITDQVTDVASHPLDNPATFRFRTGLERDHRGPGVTYIPARDARGVGVDTTVTAMFDEPVNATGIDSSTFFLTTSHGQSVHRGEVAIAPDAMSAVLTPFAPLPAGQEVRIQLSVHDLAGNSGFSFASFFTAGSADLEPPSIISLSPADGSTGVPINARIAARFDEEIARGSATDGSIRASFNPDIPGSVRLGNDPRTVIFEPTDTMPPATVVDVNIEGLADLNGNVMAPVTSRFTTSASASPDTLRPTLISSSPINGATDVSPDSPVVLTFSEDLDPTSISDMSILVRTEQAFDAIAGDFSVSGPVATFTPLAAFPGETGIRVGTYRQNPTDLAGNSAFFFLFFETGPSTDSTPPEVLMVTPPDGAADVAPGTDVVLTFSESLSGATISDETFALFANGERLSRFIRRSADNRTITLDGSLPADSTITVVATGDVEDLSGNKLTQFQSSFRTAPLPSSPFQRPRVTRQRPANGAADTPLDGRVTLFFDLALDADTVPGALVLTENGQPISFATRVLAEARIVEITPDTPFSPDALVQLFLTEDAKGQNGAAVFSYQASFRTLSSAAAPPRLVRFSPGGGVSPINTVPTLEYSEPLDPASVDSSSVMLTQPDGTAVEATISLTGNGALIRIEPSAALAPSSSYRVRTTTAIRDLDGESQQTETDSFFFVGEETDATPPVITSVSPPDGTVDVGVNALIRIRLNERINVTTANETTIQLSNGSGPVLSCTMSFSVAGAEVTFTPNAPLEASSLYTLTIDGLEDLAGNPAQPKTTQFTTGGAADFRSPRAIFVSPTGDSVPVNAMIVIAADEPLDPGSVRSDTVSISGGFFGPRDVDVSLSADGRRIFVAPNMPLPVGQRYSIRSLGFPSSVTDLSGNPFPFHGDFSSGFSSDGDGPQVASVTPPDGVAEVPINAAIRVRFDEQVRPSAVDLVNVANGAVVDATAVLSEGNSLVRLTPVRFLEPNQSYAITIGGAVVDTSGNAMGADVTTTFTTGSLVDLKRPVITTSPPDRARGVGIGVAPRAVFDEPVVLDSFPNGARLDRTRPSFRETRGATVFSADAKEVTFSPEGPLEPAASYRFSVSGEDLAGNSFFGRSEFDAAGGAGVDNDPPQVLSVSPPNGAIGVPTNALVRLQFDEGVDLISATPGSIVLANGAVVETDANWSNDRRQLTLTPAGPLPAGSLLTLSLNSLADVSGNVIAPFTSSFTVDAGGVEDLSAPTVVSVTPADGAAGVSPLTTIEVELSEPLDPVSISDHSVGAFVSGFGEIRGTVALSGNRVVFTPFAPLPGASTVSASLRFNGVADFAGNLFTSFFGWSFETAASTDATPPQVQMITPMDGSTGVSLTTPVVITFSEAIQQSSAGINFALLANGERLSAFPRHSDDNRTVTLSTPFPPESTVTVLVGEGIQDMNGNSLGEFRSQFTTGPAAGPEPFRRVSLQRPPAGARGVSVSSPISIVLTAPMTADELQKALIISDNGVVKDGTATLRADGRVIEFTPATPFSKDSIVQIFLQTFNVRQTENERDFDYQATFRTEIAVAAPSLVALSPNRFNTPANAVFLLAFDAPLDPSTVNSTTVGLFRGGTQLDSVVSLEDGDKTIRIDPVDDLLPGFSHRLRITGEIRGVSGEPVNPFFLFSFRPTEDVDSAPPVLFSISPPDGFSGIGVNAEIRARFNERISTLTANRRTMVLSDGSGAEIPCTFSFGFGDSEVTLSPHALLTPNTTYTITVDGVEDLAGNRAAAATNQFTTAAGPDFDPPRTVRSHPFSGATDVPVNIVLEFEANEPLDPSSATPNSVSLRDRFNFQSVPIDVAVEAGGLLVTVTPRSPLAVGRPYEVEPSSLTDLAGNRLLPSRVFFSTGFLPDADPPRVSAIGPSDGMTNVPLNARVKIRFDEPVTPSSTDAVSLANGAPVDVIPMLSNGNRLLTLIPVIPLDANQSYTVTVPAGLADFSGNTLGAPVSSTFTTGDQFDFTSTTATVSPSVGTGISTAVTIRLRFEERVNVATVGVDTLFLTNAERGLGVAGAVMAAPDALSAMFTPLEPLGAGAFHRFTASGLTDLAGNPLHAATSFTTAVGPPDVQAPSVVLLSVPDGAADVPVNALLVAEFDEPIDAGSLTSTSVRLANGVSVPGVSSVSGPHLTYRPNDPLPANTTLTFTVEGLTDFAGNVMAPFSSSFTTRADTTADTTRPSIVSVSPADGSTAPVGTSIVWTISEPVSPVFATSVHVQYGPEFISIQGTTTVNGATVTFTPDAPLPPGTTFTATIFSLRDYANNFSNSLRTTFTTAGAPAVDVDPPQVIMVSPAEGSVEVQRSPVVTLTFSEPLSSATVNNRTIVLFVDGVPFFRHPSRSSDGRTVTLERFLPRDALVEVVATSGVTDLAGNPLADFKSSFRTAPEPDVQGPRVLNQRPARGATGVPADAMVTFFMDEPMDASTIPTGVFVSQNGVLVSGVASLSAGGQLILFTPDTAFPPGSLVQVFLRDVADLQGNQSSYDGSFRIAEDDSGPPHVVRFSPSGSNFPTNASILAEYSEPLDPASITDENVKLSVRSTSEPVAASLTLVNGGRTIQVDPTSSLTPETEYLLDLMNVRDLSGDPQDRRRLRVFLTGASADEVAPQLLSVLPPDGATGIGANALIRLVFDEPINPLTATDQTIQILDGGSPAISCSISFSNLNREVTIQPNSPFDGATTLELMLAGVMDVAGNPVSPATISTSFTTLPGGDFTSPQFVRSNPVSNSQNVPINTVVSFQMDEPLDSALLDPNGVRIFGSAEVPSTVSLSSDGSTVIVAPQTTLEPNLRHSLQAFPVRDLSGNQRSVGFSFTTSAASDTTPPSISGQSPAAGSLGLGVNTGVSVLFDEPIQQGDAERVKITLAGVEIDVNRMFTDADRLLTLRPARLLDPLTSYNVQVGQVRDIAGNERTATVTTALATGPGVDLSGPTIVSIDPGNGSTNIPVNFSVSVAFSESLDPAGVLPFNIFLEDLTTFRRTDAQLTLSADGATVTITPDQDLSPATNYRLRVFGGIRDVVGNGYSGTSVPAQFSTAP